MTVSLVALAGLASALVGAGPSSAQEGSAQQPWTVPALRQWTGHGGTFTLTSSTRVVVRSNTLSQVGAVLAADLTDVLGRPVHVDHGQPRAHDLVLRSNPEVTKPEGYRLDVGDQVSVDASTATGAFWGTRSVLQMLRRSTTIPGGTAEDWPAYRYRGIELCNCYKFFSVPWIKTLIRQMSYLKYNQLYLSMVVQSATRPEDTPDTDAVYTPAQVREIVAFGKRYHVSVGEEFNSPGHMDLSAHPDLQLRDASGAVHAGNIDMGNPAAFPYTSGVLGELMAQFPGDLWYGGGDEYLGSAAEYENYPSLARWAHQQAGPSAPAADSWVLWQNQLDAYARQHGRQLHAWNDQYFAGMPTALNKDIAIDYWVNYSGRMTPQQIVDSGHDIMNTSDALYFTGKTPPSASWIYDTFTPNLFSGKQTIAADDPHLLGSSMAIWPRTHDGSLSEEQEAEALDQPLKALAQKDWGSAPLTADYPSFVPIMSAIGTAPGYFPHGAVDPGRYTVRNSTNGRTLSGTADGVSVGTASGQWQFVEDEWGHYQVVEPATGQCLTVKDDSYRRGDPVVLATCAANAADQQWLVEPVRHGRFALRADNSGQLLTADGAAAVQSYDNPSADQTWLLASSGS